MLSRYSYINRIALQNVSYFEVGVAKRFTAAAQAEVKKHPTEAQETANEINLKSARPFEEIPGPSKYELVRAFLPGGYLYKKSAGDLTLLLGEKYGNLYRIPGLFGRPEIIATLNPDDYPIIFRNEGIWPARRNFQTLVYYREVYRRDFFQGVEGIISTEGEKWGKMRTAVNPILMQPRNARLYLNTMLEVNDEFLERIRDIRDPLTKEMPDTFEDELLRVALENVAAVALNTHLGLIHKNRDNAEAKTIINSVRRFFDLAYDLEVKPSFWKVIKTPKFYEIIKTMDTLTNCCNKYIDEAFAKISHDTEGKLTSEVGKEKSVLEKLLRVDKRLAVVMALDMMMAGVDTTSSAFAGVLLGIAKNPEKQARLFREIIEILPRKDSLLTMETMRNLPYLRACIKEGIRMYPVVAGTMRRLPLDVALSGYRVKAGNDILISSNLQLLNEEFVPRAKQFLPERWLREEAHSADIMGHISNPFMYLPFGFGPRSCAGKRIVDLELEITVARLVRNFNIEFNYPVENAFKAKLISVPNIPLKFKMEERKE